MLNQPVYVEYRLYDGNYIGGTCELELVEAMAARKFTSPRSRRSYRRATAKRVEGLWDVIIDPTTDESFIAGLLNNQLLEAVK